MSVRMLCMVLWYSFCCVSVSVIVTGLFFFSCCIRMCSLVALTCTVYFAMIILCEFGFMVVSC